MAHEKFTYYGEISGGESLPDDPALLRNINKSLEGQRVTWTVEKWVRQRTSAQNRAWWGSIIGSFCKPACLAMRNKKEVHRIVLTELHHYDVIIVKGREVFVLKPTHDLPTNEFAELFEAAQQLASEWFNYFIPDPDPELRKAH